MQANARESDQRCEDAQVSERTRRLVAICALTGATLVTLAQSNLGVQRVSFDFIERYAGGKIAADGRSPYDDQLLFKRERLLGADQVVPVYDAPPVVAAFRVLALLPLRAAALLLALLSLAACVILAGVLTRGSPPTHQAVVTVAVLVFSPARHTLHLGQIDLIAMAGVLLLARWQPVLAIAKPQTTGLTALALFAERRHQRPLRAVLMAGVGALLVVAASAALAGSATWADWANHLRDRYEGADRWLLVLACAGAAVVLRAALRARAARPLDLVCVAGAATGLLAVTGGWNPQWFLAQAVPLGALLLAVRARRVALRRHQSALLVVACAFSAGDAYVVYSFNFRVWVPVAILACLLVGLVALREVPPGAAMATLVLNAAITAVPLSKTHRALVPVLVTVILLYLVLELRPHRAGAIGVPAQADATAG